MLFILLYSAGDVVRGSKRGTVCSFSANDAGLRMLIIRNNSLLLVVPGLTENGKSLT